MHKQIQKRISEKQKVLSARLACAAAIDIDAAASRSLSKIARTIACILYEFDLEARLSQSSSASNCRCHASSVIWNTSKWWFSVGMVWIAYAEATPPPRHGRA